MRKRSGQPRKSIRQVPIPPEILQQGAFGPHNNLLPWGPLATVRCRPDALSRALNIEFQDSFDDLDDLRVALVEVGQSGRPVALVQHLNAPVSDTIIHVKADDRLSVEALVDEVITGLGIDVSDVTWTRPAAPAT